MKVIQTQSAPAAIGPYSQAVKTAGLVYASGQIPIDPATGEVFGDSIAEQAHRVFQNIGAVLKAAGTSFEKVVKTTCFLKSLEDFNTFNEIYSQYFCGEIKPARSCVEVSKLPKRVLVEVEAIAEL